MGNVKGSPGLAQTAALISCFVSFVTIVAGGIYLHNQQADIAAEATTRSGEAQSYTAATCADVRFILKHLIASDVHVAGALRKTNPAVASFRADEAKAFAAYPATVCQTVPAPAVAASPIPRSTVKAPTPVPTPAPTDRPNPKPKGHRR